MASAIVLPTARSKPAPSLSKLKGFLYSPAKWGKSTFLAGIPNGIIAPTEKGLDNISCMKVEEPYPIDSWDALKSALNAIVESGKYESIAIDTADNAYRLCGEAVCGKKNWEHLEDPGYGKGFAYVDTEFEAFLRKLSYLDMGIWFTSHATDREVETRVGKVRKWTPTLRATGSNSPIRVILGWADVILFGDYERVEGTTNGAVKRVIRTKPSLTYEAGDRTGLLPETINGTWDDFAKHFKVAAKAVKSGKQSEHEPEATVASGKSESEKKEK